jgi:hypothetical protein
VSQESTQELPGPTITFEEAFAAEERQPKPAEERQPKPAEQEDKLPSSGSGSRQPERQEIVRVAKMAKTVGGEQELPA